MDDAGPVSVNRICIPLPMLNYPVLICAGYFSTGLNIVGWSYFFLLNGRIRFFDTGTTTPRDALTALLFAVRKGIDHAACSGLKIREIWMDNQLLSDTLPSPSKCRLPWNLFKELLYISDNSQGVILLTTVITSAFSKSFRVLQFPFFFSFIFLWFSFLKFSLQRRRRRRILLLMIMAADVSSLVQILNGYKEEELKNETSGGKSKSLITRDLLGGSGGFSSTELDLDLQVPTGWEKRLDMQSGKVYLQRCNSSISSSSSGSEHKHYHHQKQQQQNRSIPELQDLNFPPVTPSSNPLEETRLELRLVPSFDYQSVCTLDKVKSALERAERESGKKRSSSYASASSSSIKEAAKEIEEGEEKSSSSSGFESSSDLLLAAGCPGCLLYVLISKNNPKCPRCDSIVPIPLQKKPKIDLNTSI
ncbi:uncharacterized protein LOC122639132 [Telopea speciosissima]|uniref:uncharacterized protein LOC122639132 n=1 Tax=Telopea speciosissima TaxID=54955 RepID=UPI001CC7C869|nr:uncharacterized protein LOC122639132 [Telopea speciosissima]